MPDVDGMSPVDLRGGGVSTGAVCPTGVAWLKAGILAGALAGALDASGSVLRGIGGLTAD